MNKFNVTVFLEDTDAGGIVYHSKYLNFMERCRTSYFYHKGIDHAQLIASGCGHFVVKYVDIDYKQPARLGDELTATVEAINIRGASIVCNQRILKNEQIIVDAKVILAFINPNSGQPIRIPESLKSKML
jgi:acyl-CoA thioester hydrolase